ncbi:hypothetical protein J6Q66_00520 [bacterium]|nr:hypothetical protein [bacterium]
MNNQLTKRRNPFEKPLQQPQEESNVEVIEEKSNEIISEGEEIVFETPIQKSEPVYSPQPQPQYQQQPQYYEPKNTQRVRNSSQNVVNRETKQYYNVSNEVSRDKFTSTMETSLRRSIKIVCAQRGIMFAQFVEDACREKLRREGVK